MAEEPENPQDEQPPSEEQGSEETPAEEQGGDETPAEEAAAPEQAAPPEGEAPAAADAPAEAEAEPPEAAKGEPADEGEAVTERPKPEIPGADLEVDIVPEGFDPLTGRPIEAAEAELTEAEEAEAPAAEEAPEEPRPVAQVAIDLGAGARYGATGKRKSAVARVILKPGSGEYAVNGRPLEVHFPRSTLQRNIRQPLETVGYESRMDVVARLHGGGVAAQAGALRHGIARALIEADPNLRSELKRRGFLTRDPRVKERKKAGLKKARKRPQFSKR